MRCHLQRALNQVPLPPWALNMNAHAEQIGAIVRAALAPCERSAWTPRQPCVSAKTLGLMRLRRRVQPILRFAPKEYWAWEVLSTQPPQQTSGYAPQACPGRAT